ncbi:MAG: DNA-binding protein [Lachnospiraceae bacterium]|nr:DNA-binding protein [Lachnospiraceae bacterium]
MHRKKRGISERREQKLCEENRIPSAAKFSRLRLIPKYAEKLADKRRKFNGKERFHGEYFNCRR